MLINLTNHPVKGVLRNGEYYNPWPKEQYDMAIEQYDEIIELPFPDISPYWSSSEIKCLAEKYCNKCISILKVPSVRNAIHIGGETMFCYYIISLLKSMGYQVVSASSERIVEDLGGNLSIKKFRFIKFRIYE